MADYADWTESIELLGSEIMLPIDVQGAVIMLPLDIQGATIMMPVDLQGQTVDLDINIVAQTVDVTINITAQTVAIKSQGEWSPQQGQQKYFQASAGNIAYSYGANTYYTVPTGKTLYLTHLTFGCWAYAAADGDKDQIAYCHIRNHTDDTILAALGGSGGGSVSFPTPLKVSAGKLLDLTIINYANHAVNVWASCGGYEI
jgi:hypothetical protein